MAVATVQFPPDVLHGMAEYIGLSAIAATATASRECHDRSIHALCRRWCCRTCGLPQVHPKRVREYDGSYLLCEQGEDERQSVNRGEPLKDVCLQEHVLMKLGYSGNEACLFRPLNCAGCGKHIGDECDECVVRTNSASTNAVVVLGSLRASNAETLQLFAAGALALHDAAGRIPRRGRSLSRSPRTQPRPLLCSGARGSCGSACGAPLSRMDEVISTQHCWRPIGSALSERAWFVNNADANLRVGVPQEKQLAQGVMYVADVFCPKCGANVGWQFTSDASLANRSQVGRFGLVLSSIQMKNDALAIMVMRLKSWAMLEWLESYDEDAYDSLEKRTQDSLNRLQASCAQAPSGMIEASSSDSDSVDSESPHADLSDDDLMTPSEFQEEFLRVLDE